MIHGAYGINILTPLSLSTIML